ncbi:hypothetical protein [Salininema proteolyticum]|uniref:YbaB/EbfC DNA-binding family protein n=1 Tax=Salininema proteolyticum TaxID=1607685 RepID=A0ABV8TUJ6_9ACTN
MGLPENSNPAGVPRAVVDVDKSAEFTKEVVGGQIRVIASYPGKVEIEVLDQWALRMDVQTLSEELTDGVNAALKGLRAELGGVDEESAADGFAQRLEAIGRQAEERMEAAMEAVRFDRDSDDGGRNREPGAA